MPARKTTSPALGAPAQRFRHAQQELHQLDYFLKKTVSKRMMKCGQPQCACHRDPSQRHGPYFEWTYKVKGKTINVKLSAQAAPLYQAATKQNHKLKAVLAKMERWSRAALARPSQFEGLTGAKPFRISEGYPREIGRASCRERAQLSVG